MSKLEYRPWSVAYQAGLERLFAEDTEWGELTARMWREFVLDAPFGPPVGTVTIDTASGDVVGQLAFLPMRLQIDGREVSGYRPYAPIVSRRIRGLLHLLSGLNHPVAKMYLHAMDEVRAAGAGVVYMLPDPRWVRFLKRFSRFQLGKFPLFSRLLPLAAPMTLDPGFESGVLDSWDERVDDLWRRFAAHQPVGLRRDAALLRWKIGRGDWEVLQVLRHGALVGLIASRHKGDRQWLVGDLLADDMDASLRNTLAAAINLGDRRSREATPDKPLEKLAILATPSMEPALRGLGFVREAYDFLISVETLDPSIAPATVAPGRWHVGAGD